jgi:hypothetical protein
MAEEEWRAMHSVWVDWLGVLNESTFKPGLVRFLPFNIRFLA